MVVFVESSCIPEKVVVFGQKCLNSGNSGCIRAEVVVFGQKCLYSGNVVAFHPKWSYSGKSGVF